MDYLVAVLLGLIQALTEFFPISSSAHLLVIPWFFHRESSSLFFDVLLHWGTAMAVLVYFHREWLEIAWLPIRFFRNGWNPAIQKTYHLALLLVLGTIPAILGGYFAKKILEQDLRKPWIAAFCLVFFGIWMVVADRCRPQARVFEEITWPHSLFIGLMQALALIPGVSRSGITITAGRLLGIRRVDAARFSFLLSTPAIFGAALLETYEFFKTPASHLPPLAPTLLGTCTSAIAGIICIHYFLKLLRQNGLEVFAIYRCLLALVICYRYFF